MRKALLLGTGVVLALTAAVFVGAAAATQGAPVFYDARYPVPASVDPEGYDVADVGVVEPGSDGTVDEADAAEEPISTPPDADVPTESHPAPPATPPTAAIPPTGTPTPTPDPDVPSDEPSDDPSDDPGDDPASDEPTPEGPDSGAFGSTPGAPSVAERQTWLAFQQIVRECMAGAVQEYLYWEWWNPGAGASGGFPAMPVGLSAEEVAAWEFALHGDSGLGDDYRWQDAGCWGSAVHVTGNTN